MTTHELVDLRLAIIRYILLSNLETEIFDQLKALLANPDPEVALRALQNLGGWINLRPDLFDIYLTFLEPLVRRGEVVPYRCTWGAARLLDANSEATPEQLTRALTVAKMIARNPNNGYERSLLFRGIGERGEDEGRKLLVELKKDREVAADARLALKDLARNAQAHR